MQIVSTNGEVLPVLAVQVPGGTYAVAVLLVVQLVVTHPGEAGANGVQVPRATAAGPVVVVVHVVVT